MKKEIKLCLIFFFLFIHCFSQSDSLHAVSVDTPGNDSASVIPQHRMESIPVQNKKEPVYTLKPAIDLTIIAVGTLWSGYAFTKIYVKSSPTVEQIEALKTSDINVIDRWAIYPYSASLDKISYYPFYAAIPLPLIYFLSDKETNSDFWKLTLLYWEAMSVTGLTGTSATYFVDRYRPYAYSSETSMEKRTGSIVKNSFYSGHVQVVATPTFFIAKVYADYHPDSKIKWVFYGIASVATGTTAYLRLIGGEHFPTDLLIGTATGVLAGILVPQLHKTHSTKSSALRIMPYSTGEVNGLYLTYQFKK